MFKIFDGRESFYQWDLNRKLIVEDSSIKEVHFSNRMSDNALVCEVYTDNGLTLVNVPNILLQQSYAVNIYAYDGESTRHSKSFEVMLRTKPADYVYTETEVKNWEKYGESIAELEKAAEELKGTAAELEEFSNKTYSFNFEELKDIKSPLTNSPIIRKEVIKDIKNTNFLYYEIELLAAEIDTTSNSVKKLFDLPITLNITQSGLEIRTISNISEFTPLIKNKLIGDYKYDFERLAGMIREYISNSTIDFYSNGVNTSGYKLAYFKVRWELEFANENIRNAFYNEFSPVLSATTDFLLEHNSSKMVNCAYIGG